MDTTLARPEPAGGRILLAPAPGGPDPTALELAIALARRGDGELTTILLEDVDLLAAAALPVSRELVRDSGTERALGRERLARALRAEAMRLKQLVTQRAKADDVRCTFIPLRGSRLGAPLSALGPTDLLVMGRGPQRPWHHRPLGTHAVALCHRSADNDRLEMVIAAIGGAIAIDCTSAAQKRPHRLLARLRLHRPSVLILPLAGDRTTDLLGVLIEHLDCPLLIVPEGRR